VRRLASTAFVWQGGTMTSLGGGDSEALALNERGQIIGYARTRTNDTHAVLWTKNGG
jgi:probable HAF family extracellular repeat protein